MSLKKTSDKEIAISSLTLRIGGTVAIVSVEEARKLFDVLSELFQDHQVTYVPVYPPVVYTKPLPSPWCGDISPVISYSGSQFQNTNRLTIDVSKAEAK